MSRKFLTSIDLNQNELQNARIQNLATAPSSPVTGQIYYNTTSNALFFYNGTSFISPSSNQIAYGLLSARPTAASGNSGTFYYATDNFLLYYSNGTTWQQTDNFGSGQSTTVTIAGSAADGTSTNYARADHAHAGPGFGAVTAQTTNGASSANGSATTVAHSDHTHGTPSLTAVTPSNVTATSAAVGTGTAAAHEDHVHGFTPSGFALSAFGAATSAISIGGYQINNVATPTASTDAANKGYVDSTAQGLNVKGSVLVASTANVSTLVGGGVVIDGVTAVAGSRVLLKNQTTSSQNGIYVTATGAWSRSADQQTPAVGDFTFVESGNTQASQGFIVTSVTGGVTWTQFSAAGEYTAGNGITITGQSIAFNPTSTGGLQASGSGASILLQTNSGLATTSSGLAVGAGTGISVSTGTVSIDTTVVARKFSQTLSTSSTSYTITHNLGTLDVIVQVYAVADGSEVIVDNLRATTNTVTLNFSVAPSANAYRVVILG
jgi:hypothetical protein